MAYLSKQTLFYGLSLLFLGSLPAWADPSGGGHHHSSSLGDASGSGFASGGSGFGGGSGPSPSGFGAGGFSGGGAPAAPPAPAEKPVKLSAAGTAHGTGLGAHSKTLDVASDSETERSVRSLSSVNEPGGVNEVVRIGRRSN